MEGNPLASLLNQNTPYAPKSEADVTQRLAAASSSKPNRDSANESPTDQRPLGKAREQDRGGISTVFVPTVVETSAGERPTYQLRLMDDGRPGLAIYTSAELLEERLGRDQAWVEASLLELLYIVGRDQLGVALNPYLRAEDETHPGGEP